MLIPFLKKLIKSSHGQLSYNKTKLIDKKTCIVNYQVIFDTGFVLLALYLILPVGSIILINQRTQLA